MTKTTDLQARRSNLNLEGLDEGREAARAGRACMYRACGIGFEYYSERTSSWVIATMCNDYCAGYIEGFETAHLG